MLSVRSSAAVTYALIFGAAFSTSCGGGAEDAQSTPAVARELRLERVDLDASRSSMFPRLARGVGEEVLVSYLQKAGDGHELRIAKIVAGERSSSQLVAKLERPFVNWADFPSIASAGSALAVHWLERNGNGRYAYGVRIRCSTDGGRSWGDPFWLHDDVQGTEHGFVTLLPAGPDRFDAVWLDGRSLASSGDMQLRARQFDVQGNLTPEHVLDDRVCECCATDVAVADGKLVVVYRDRAASGERDISVVRRVRGAWTEPGSCAYDGWLKPG